MDKPARLAYVYALIDPRTGEIRYIGSSTRPRRRLQDQLAAARAHHRLRSLGRTRSTSMAEQQRLAWERKRARHDAPQVSGAGAHLRACLLGFGVGLLGGLSLPLVAYLIEWGRRGPGRLGPSPGRLA
jgi:hypothetical protein